MYPILLFFVMTAVSEVIVSVSNYDFHRGWIFRRQDAFCSSAQDCQTNEQCCAETCVDSDLTCCPDDQYWCPMLGDSCLPCPSGETCYDQSGQVAPWCCSSSDSCVLLVSSGSTVATVTATLGSSSAMSTPQENTSSPAPSPSTIITTLPTAPTLSIPTSTTSSVSVQSTTESTISTTTSATSMAKPVQSSSDHTPSSMSSSAAISSIVPPSNPSPTTFIYPPLPIYTGGDLLRNYCSIPEFTLIPGPQSTIVYWAAFIGCLDDKPDCCPYVVTTPTSTMITTATTTIVMVSFTEVTETSTFILTATPSPNQSISTTAYTSPPRVSDVFPGAANSSQATLSKCPDDYHVVSSSCCPSGYILYTSAIGGVTPCYSPLPSPLSVAPPPPAPVTIIATSTVTASGPIGGVTLPPSSAFTTEVLESVTTTIFNNDYFAIPYAVQVSGGSALSTGSIAAIAAVSVVGASAIPVWLLLRWLRQRNNTDPDEALDERKRYTVAWIAPLWIEALAARYMLDNIHDVKFTAGPGDDYIYTAGDINGHNVIIATLPSGHSYGVGPAAALARDIRTKFPNLWFGLLVGIAAGLPNHSENPPRDIRLGDVLVAEGERGKTGIVSYGSGKETAEEFQLLGTNHNTAKLVSSAIGNIKLTSSPVNNPWSIFRKYYEEIKNKKHSEYGTFRDPGQSEDHLHITGDGRSRTEHQGGDTIEVEQCEPELLQRRRRPDDERIKVWYGKIGSGDKVMKDAGSRDQLKGKHDIIGLEMEAAGIMDIIPVGVIRGVSDYGDKYKNDEWKPFAAAMAAAFAKALLYQITPIRSGQSTP